MCCLSMIMCCQCSMHASSSNHTETIKTFIDLRNQSPSHYRRMNRQIGILHWSNTMEIDFDLNVKKMISEHLKSPLLLLFGGCTQLVCYLDGRGGFGISHHDHRTDDIGDFENLIGCNLRLIPSVAQRNIQHFHIVIFENHVNDRYISLGIDGYSTNKTIQRDIFQLNDTLTVLWGGAVVSVNETVRNVIVRYD